MNPAHEEADPQASSRRNFRGVHVSLSSEVLPRIREWPRLSTTLLNAYLEPVLVRYIDHLNQGLDEAGVDTQQRFLMQSNGGVMPFSAAIAGGRTVHTLFSGPCGRRAGERLSCRGRGAAAGWSRSTWAAPSADIAFIEGGVPLETTESVIARRQIDVPALDMTSISAGGGSIAWVDGGGFLNVGPQSAGADPGPACYGRGGTQPDGHRCRCRLRLPQSGLFPRRRADARRRRIAIGLAGARSPRRSRWACWKRPPASSASSTCAWPTRCACLRPSAASTFRPSRCLPFGGAGAVHAAAVAEELGMRRILVPPRPGAFSALGLLCTDVVHDYIRSELRPLGRRHAGSCRKMFRQLEAKARDELAAEGMDRGRGAFPRELDLRYTGQGYELRTPLDGLYRARLTAASLGRRARAFRRTPCADPRPRREGAAGRNRQLSPARARRCAEISAARRTPAAASRRRAEAAIKGKRTRLFRRQGCDRGGAL